MVAESRMDKILVFLRKLKNIIFGDPVTRYSLALMAVGVGFVSPESTVYLVLFLLALFQVEDKTINSLSESFNEVLAKNAETVDLVQAFGMVLIILSVGIFVYFRRTKESAQPPDASSLELAIGISPGFTLEETLTNAADLCNLKLLMKGFREDERLRSIKQDRTVFVDDSYSNLIQVGTYVEGSNINFDVERSGDSLIVCKREN